MKVFIIGTGNVATSLGRALMSAGHTITGVWGRDAIKSDPLAHKLRCSGYTDAASIPGGADVYLLAIKDDAIKSVAKKLPLLQGIVAHTSGASPVTNLKRFSNYGVFYPVETITKNHPRSFKKVPFCIEGSDEPTFQKLTMLAKTVSSEIYALNSRQRAKLHVAAVFTNNFTNYLLGIATGILEKEDLPASLLKSLAESTVRNVFEEGARKSQTGPASRNDEKTITMHIEMLKNNKKYQKLYRLFSDMIRDEYNKKKFR